MKENTALLLIAGIIAVILLTSATGNNGIADFSGLVAIYGEDKVGRLQNLYNAMKNKGLSSLQIKLMLSQALLETGLFTMNPDIANYNLMDNQNNFAGIKVNSRYPVDPGNGFANYPDLDSFVDDWMLVLSNHNNPLGASGVDDFNLRLKENGYYGQNPTTLAVTNYNRGLWNYYTLLDQYIN